MDEKPGDYNEDKMKITEVRVKLPNSDYDEKDKLLAFVSVVFDGELALHDIKIINGYNGVFVAMPDRKLVYSCNDCGWNNPLLAHFCSFCGTELDKTKEDWTDEDGKVRLHVNTAHPITQSFREYLTEEIMIEYERMENR